MKEECIFCKLANGVFPTNAIYEDEDFKVILDANPATKGHALIIPKEHYANIYELPDELCAKVLPLAKKLAEHMTDKLKCDGFNIVQNNGETAGQTVFHFHTHLIPRYQSKDAILTWTHEKFTEEEMKSICEELSLLED